MMQAQFDAKPIFVHKTDKYSENQNISEMISSINLSYWEILKIFHQNRIVGATCIFHAQSSLPYLLFGVFLRSFMRSKSEIQENNHDIRYARFARSEMDWEHLA